MLICGCVSAHAIEHTIAPEHAVGEVVRRVMPKAPPLVPGRIRDDYVVAALSITTEGTVSSPELLVGKEPFASAALDALAQWRFRPILVNGKAVATATRLAFHFWRDVDGEARVSVAYPLGEYRTLSPDGDESRLLRVSSATTDAARTQKHVPTYPARAKKLGVEGQVLLRAIIAEDGRVALIEPLTGNDMLVQAAVDAVKNWRYRPYVLNGKAVPVETQVRLMFQIK